MGKRNTVIPWPEIRAAFCCGLTLKECAEKFGQKEGTINSRCSREKWTRTMMEAKAAAHSKQLVKQEGQLEVLPGKEAFVVLAEDLAQRGENHKMVMAKMVEIAMEKASYNLPPVEKMQDLKILDDIARRNFGLDQDQIAKTCILNLQILLAD